jgi:hypothetical protein
MLEFIKSRLKPFDIRHTCLETGDCARNGIDINPNNGSSESQSFDDRRSSSDEGIQDGSTLPIHTIVVGRPKICILW